MGAPITLIIGLGNPGANYEQTRHNAGAWFIQNVAQSMHTVLKPAHNMLGLHAQSTLGQSACHLFIPSTYMNQSGLAIKAITRYYRIAAQALLVAHDDIDLPLGVVRLKFDGGHGGHNGLRDIIKHLNTTMFYRLRIGIGRPTQPQDVVDYVLKSPSKTERNLIDTALTDAQAVLPLLLAGNIQQATMALHSKK